MNKYDEIKKLGVLRDQGLLTEAEFQEEKWKLLGHERQDKDIKQVSEEKKTSNVKKASAKEVSNQTIKKEKASPKKPIKTKQSSQAKEHSKNNVRITLKPVQQTPTAVETTQKTNNNKTVLYVIIGTVIVGLAVFFILDPLNLFKESSKAGTTSTTTNNSTKQEDVRFVITGGLNMRKDPYVGDNVLDFMAFGSEVQIITEEEKPDESDVRWANVKYQNKEGWAAIEINGSEVLSKIDKFNDYKLLYGDEYIQGAEYAKLPVRCFDLIVDDLKDDSELGDFKIFSNTTEKRKNGIKNIIALNMDFEGRFESDKKYYAVLLQNQTSNDFKVYILYDEDEYASILDIHYSHGNNPHINMITNTDSEGYYQFDNVAPDANAVELSYNSRTVVGYLMENEIQWNDKDQLIAVPEEDAYNGPATIIMENRSNRISRNSYSYFKALYDPRMYDDVQVSVSGGYLIAGFDGISYGVKPAESVTSVTITMTGRQNNRTYSIYSEKFYVD